MVGSGSGSAAPNLILSSLEIAHAIRGQRQAFFDLTQFVILILQRGAVQVLDFMELLHCSLQIYELCAPLFRGSLL
jgi:hypothetical protein